MVWSVTHTDMAPFIYTREDVIARLDHHRRGRSKRALAKDIGIPVSYLCDVYNGQKNPGPTILKFLGLTKDKRIFYIVESEVA